MSAFVLLKRNVHGYKDTRLARCTMYEAARNMERKLEEDTLDGGGVTDFVACCTILREMENRVLGDLKSVCIVYLPIFAISISKWLVPCFTCQACSIQSARTARAGKFRVVKTIALNATNLTR